MSTPHPHWARSAKIPLRQADFCQAWGSLGGHTHSPTFTYPPSCKSAKRTIPLSYQKSSRIYHLLSLTCLSSSATVSRILDQISGSSLTPFTSSRLGASYTCGSSPSRIFSAPLRSLAVAETFSSTIRQLHRHISASNRTRRLDQHKSISALFLIFILGTEEASSPQNGQDSPSGSVLLSAARWFAGPLSSASLPTYFSTIQSTL